MQRFFTGKYTAFETTLACIEGHLEIIKEILKKAETLAEMNRIKLCEDPILITLLAIKTLINRELDQHVDLFRIKKEYLDPADLKKASAEIKKIDAKLQDSKQQLTEFKQLRSASRREFMAHLEWMEQQIKKSAQAVLPYEPPVLPVNNNIASKSC